MLSRILGLVSSPRATAVILYRYSCHPREVELSSSRDTAGCHSLEVQLSSSRDTAVTFKRYCCHPLEEHLSSLWRTSFHPLKTLLSSPGVHLSTPLSKAVKTYQKQLLSHTGIGVQYCKCGSSKIHCYFFIMKLASRIDTACIPEMYTLYSFQNRRDQ
jgi:hypothetical protein